MIDQKTKSFIIRLLLVGAVLFCGLFLAQSILRELTPSRGLHVRGMAERIVKADVASWKLRFGVQGPDINTLSSSFVSTQEKVLQFLKEQGFEEGEISLSAPVIHDRWENNLGSNRLAAEERYKANGSLTVRTTQIDALTRSAGKSSQLFQAGLSVTSDPVRYYISDFDALRPDMLIQATKSGLVMAETMARALSVKTGHLKDASSGTFSIENPDTGRTYDQDNSMYKKVRVVLNLRFTTS